ncbi:hypothetical protein ABK040_002180 [Willaertia magna]
MYASSNVVVNTGGEDNTSTTRLLTRTNNPSSVQSASPLLINSLINNENRRRRITSASDQNNLNNLNGIISSVPNSRPTLDIIENDNNTFVSRPRTLSGATNASINASNFMKTESQEVEEETAVEEESCFANWPVYIFDEKGHIFMRIICIRLLTRELFVLDPFSERVTNRFSFDNLIKVSFDNSNDGDQVTTINASRENESIRDLKLFRIQFRKKGALIFLSKDRNEIINYIAYNMREWMEYEMDTPFVLQSSTSERKVDQTEDTSTKTMDYIPNNDVVGFYEYQVFGIDRRGRYFPHTLSLFSYYIRHCDSETKVVFSQHLYTDVEGSIEVDKENQCKITISYCNDNPYIFLVSDKDRNEVLLLLKGRTFIYYNLFKLENNEFEMVQEEGVVNSTSDFPQLVSFSTHSMLMEESEMENILQNQRFKEPEYTIQTNNIEKQTVVADLNEYQREHVDFINNGTFLFLHYVKKKFLGKSNSVKLHFVRVYLELDNNIYVEWGVKPRELNHKKKVIGVETGQNAAIGSKKIKPMYTQNFSFVLRTERTENNPNKQPIELDLYLVSTDTVEYQHFIQGIRLLLKKQRENLVQQQQN